MGSLRGDSAYASGDLLSVVHNKPYQQHCFEQSIKAESLRCNSSQQVLVDATAADELVPAVALVALATQLPRLCYLWCWRPRAIVNESFRVDVLVALPLHLLSKWPFPPPSLESVSRRSSHH